MKTLSITAVLAVLGVGGFATYHVVHAQSTPPRLSTVDQLVLQRDEAKVQLIQSQAQSQIQPIVDEYQQIRARVCQTAKIPLDQCAVNTQTGLITAQAPPKPAK